MIGRVLVDPARRGDGLGTAVTREIVRTGFDELGLHRLQLAVYDFNTAAIACYERVGFVIEGRLRDSTNGWTGDARSLLLLAEVDGAVAGFVATHAIPLLERSGGVVRVVALATDSGHRRAGLGGRLLAAVEGWGRRRGCRDIELTSRRTRGDAHAFYDALGFEDACGRSALFRRSIA